MKEFDLIDCFFRNGGHQRKDVIIGIGDDAAITEIPANQRLATTTDTLVAGVHFLADTPAKAVAHKAVAVNLSDLAAMGAEPAWLNLSLSMPSTDPDWLAGFAEGLFELCQYYSVQLIGGDTVNGALAVTITAQGFVPGESVLTRSGAKPGDWIYATGTLGDAGAGLEVLKGELQAAQADAEYLVHRHQYPSPRILAGTALRRSASACIDISDGLLSDIQHIIEESGCGAVLNVDALPISQALANTVSNEQAIELALGAGDDYELLFTVAEDFKSTVETAFASFNVNATCIGQITGAVGKVELRKNDEPYHYQGARGYEHFDGR